MIKKFLFLAVASLLATFLATAAFAQSDDTAASSSVSTEVPAAGVAGQTTSPLNPEANEKRLFGVSFASESELPASFLNYSNAGDKSVDQFNYVGLNYNHDKKNVFGFRQYFTYSRDADKKVSSTDMSYPVLTYTKTFDGVAKSEAISAQFWYYAPTPALDKAIQSNGIVRADVEIAWALNPKVTLAYYMNPRQSLVPNEVSIKGADGKDKPYFAKSTLIHWGTAYYNVSDAQIYYTNLGMREDWKTKSGMELSNEQYLLNLGANFTFFKGAMTLNPELDYASAESNSSDWKAFNYYTEDKLTYVMTVAVAF